MSDPQPPLKPRSLLQWNLQTLLLLTAVVAVWVGYWRYRREIPILERDIQTMKQMVHELVVKDPRQVAVIKLAELWMNEDRWDVYLPEGNYAIRLATREIGREGLAPVSTEAPIAAGRHRIELRRDQDGDEWRIEVFVDDQPTIQASENSDWSANHYDWSGSASSLAQQPASQPLVLQRTRFFKPTNSGTLKAPPEPAEGLLLWIGRVGQ